MGKAYRGWVTHRRSQLLSGRAGVELQLKDPSTSHIITTPVTAHTRCGPSGTCHGPEVQILHSPVWAIHSTSSFQILSVVWDSLSTSWESFFWIFQDLQKYICICIATSILAKITLTCSERKTSMLVSQRPEENSLPSPDTLGLNWTWLMWPPPDCLWMALTVSTTPSCHSSAER